MAFCSKIRQVTPLIVAVCLVAYPAWAVPFSVPVEVEIWLSTPMAARSGLPSRISSWNGTNHVRIESAQPDAEQSFGVGLRDNVLRIWVMSHPAGLTKVYFAFRESATTRYLERRLELGTTWGEVEIEQLAEVIRGGGEALAEGLVGTHALDELNLAEAAGVAPATGNARAQALAPVRQEDREPTKAFVDSPEREKSATIPASVSRVELLPYASIGTRLHNGMLAGWTGGLEFGVGVRRKDSWGNCDLGAGGGLELPNEQRTDMSALTVVQSDLRVSVLCGPQLGRWGLLGGFAVAATRRSLEVADWYGARPAVLTSERVWRGAALTGVRLYYRAGSVELGLSAWLQRNDRKIVFVSDDGQATELLASTGWWEGFVSLDTRLLL